jgi:protein TonB
MSVSTCTAAVFDSAVQRRALLLCVGVSVALHGMALFVLPAFQAGAPTSGSKILTATFATDATGPGEEASFEPRPDRSRELPRHELKPGTPRPVPEPPAAAVPQVPAPASAYASSASTASPTDAAGGPAAAQARVAAVDSSGKASAGLADETLLEQYRLGLLDAARRYGRYPAQAMERGWQGRVEIRLVMGANGTMKSASVKTSSSYRILDEQALDMVKKGIEFAQVPSLLHGREFTVDVPVIFELRTG